MKGRCWFPALLPIVMFCALGPPAAAEDEAQKRPWPTTPAHPSRAKLAAISP